jgi:LacI family transcriptional regulator
VSRVLSGHPHVAEGTRARVLAIIEQTGYLPNMLARGLVTRRTRTIGLIVSNITNQFYPELIEAVSVIAADQGQSIVLGNTQQIPERQRDYLRLLIERRVDGIILTSTMLDAPYVDELIGRRYPIVLVNRVTAANGGDSVTIDNEAGARAAIAHLLALGHRRIAYLRGLPGTSTNRDRERGYTAALQSAGIPVDPELLLPGDYTPETARALAQGVASRTNRPTAVLCADDGSAFGFLDGLADAGLRVPEDCAVVGFDDVREAAYRAIGLTSIRQPVKLMAAHATERLFDRIAGGGTAEPRHVVLPAELIVRRSCGARATWPNAPAQREQSVAAGA